MIEKVHQAVKELLYDKLNSDAVYSLKMIFCQGNVGDLDLESIKNHWSNIVNGSYGGSEFTDEIGLNFNNLIKNFNINYYGKDDPKKYLYGIINILNYCYNSHGIIQGLRKNSDNTFSKTIKYFSQISSYKNFEYVYDKFIDWNKFVFNILNYIDGMFIEVSRNYLNHNHYDPEIINYLDKFKNFYLTKIEEYFIKYTFYGFNKVNWFKHNSNFLSMILKYENFLINEKSYYKEKNSLAAAIIYELHWKWTLSFCKYNGHNFKILNTKDLKIDYIKKHKNDVFVVIDKNYIPKSWLFFNYGVCSVSQLNYLSLDSPGITNYNMPYSYKYHNEGENILLEECDMEQRYLKSLSDNSDYVIHFFREEDKDNINIHQFFDMCFENANHSCYEEHGAVVTKPHEIFISSKRLKYMRKKYLRDYQNLYNENVKTTSYHYYKLRNKINFNRKYKSFILNSSKSYYKEILKFKKVGFYQNGKILRRLLILNSIFKKFDEFTESINNLLKIKNTINWLSKANNEYSSLKSNFTEEEIRLKKYEKYLSRELLNTRKSLLKEN